jgi:iron(III) transport system ATP-binding protein
MQSAPIIELEGLVHAYGAQPVIRDLSLSVLPGEMLGILGISGSGKSTLLRIIAGFVQPQKGVVRIAGQIVLEDGKPIVPTERRGLGMMFQDYALFPYLSVQKNVAYGIPDHPQREQRVQELLELVGLNDLSFRRPSTLSGGQQQRVALVRALAPEPRALLLDEPFANLDGPMRSEVGSEIRRILKAQNTAAILVTHDRREALSLSDRVAVLGPHPQGGGATLIQIDTPEALYQRPCSREVAELTGPADFIDAMAQGEFAECSLGKIPLLDPQIGPVVLVLRPPQLSFEPAEEGPFRVTERQFQGPGLQVRLEGEDGQFRAEADIGEAALGTRGRLRIAAPCSALPR